MVIEGEKKIFLRNQEETEALGAYFSKQLQRDKVVYLSGGLGSGKTTFSRGFLRGLGYQGVVKSPTFTLLEQYDFETVEIFHIDLYRLNDPNEVIGYGLLDYFDNQAIVLVEWPERGDSVLPKADISLYFEYLNEGRQVTITSA